MVSDAAAQQSSVQRRTARQSERVARANWEPTRPSVANQEPVTEQSRRNLPNPVRQSETKQSQSKGVRTVDHIKVQGVPTLPESESNSIIEPPIHSAPLDGQVTLAPLHAGSACDALPLGECGCGDVLCDGGCDSLASCGSCRSGSCGGSGCSTCGELCSPAAWRPCVTLCIPQDGWVSLEYLGWWQDGMNLPPLVTTSVDQNVPQNQAGVLTSSSTRVLVWRQRRVG